MNEKQINVLSRKIAKEILTVHCYGGSDIKCTRAQLMLRQVDGTEKNMGGRNEASIVTVIKENLLAAIEVKE
jgi:hypothetical protein